MFDFFLDTADVDYLDKTWERLYKGTPQACLLRGVTTNPNAFDNEGMKTLREWKERTR